MYGMVNQAVEGLISERFGQDVWRQVKARAGVTEAVFLQMKPYPDAVTYQLVGAASEILNMPAEALLEAFGEYWTLYTGRHGYGELFQRGGRTFQEFMVNLHDLHTHVGASFPALRPPSFWCSDIEPGRLRLHYQSEREGLAPMVIGLVKGLGAMYDTTVTVTQVAFRSASEHDEFEVTFEQAGAAGA